MSRSYGTATPWTKPPSLGSNFKLTCSSSSLQKEKLQTRLDKISKDLAECRVDVNNASNVQRKNEELREKVEKLQTEVQKLVSNSKIYHSYKL